MFEQNQVKNRSVIYSADSVHSVEVTIEWFSIFLCSSEVLRSCWYVQGVPELGVPKQTLIKFLYFDLET